MMCEIPLGDDRSGIAGGCLSRMLHGNHGTQHRSRTAQRSLQPLCIVWSPNDTKQMPQSNLACRTIVIAAGVQGGCSGTGRGRHTITESSAAHAADLVLLGHRFTHSQHLIENQTGRGELLTCRRHTW